MITVVCALLLKDNKILIAKRLKGNYMDKWEFPGGKVEAGETEEQALAREIKEEMNIEIVAEQFICNNIFESVAKVIDLRLYLCKHISGEIVLNDHSEYKYVDINELFSYDLAGADIPIAKYIIDNKIEI